MNMRAEDNRVLAKWSGQVTIKHYAELYSVAKYALIDSGKKYLANKMHADLLKAKSRRDGLKVIQNYVKFQ